MTGAARVVVAVALVAACRVDAEVGSNLIARDAAPDSGVVACGDELDNDGDGRADFPFDVGCDGYSDPDETDPAVLPACWNGDDDDGDLVTDFPLERGCLSAADPDETDPAVTPECIDGIDNDDSGETDYPADRGCYAVGDLTEHIVIN